MGEDGHGAQCGCKVKHDGHLCVLRVRGKIREVTRRTCSPNVACHACGEKANSAEDVCQPVPLFI